MGDAEFNDVTNGNVVARRDCQEGVLVVELEDLGARYRQRPAGPEDREHHRKALIERHVAHAHAADRQAGLRPRQHLGPQAQSRTKRISCGNADAADRKAVARVKCAKRAIIDTMVVEEDGAAAQHQRRIAVPGNGRRKRGDHFVEQNRAAGRDDQRHVAAGAGAQPQEHVGGHRQQSRDRLLGAAGVGLRRGTFVGGNSGNQQPSAGCINCIGDRLGFASGPGACPPRTEFDKHAQRRQHCIGPPGFGERIHGTDRVGEDEELDAWPGANQRREPVRTS